LVLWALCSLFNLRWEVFYLSLLILVTLNCYLLPYRRVRFTPPGAKYLILDDFQFRIDPQIINYNGMSFHISMGLSKLGRATACWSLGRSLGRPRSPSAWPRFGSLGGGGLALACAAATRPHKLTRRDSDS
jgi:hypothetical protein